MIRGTKIVISFAVVLVTVGVFGMASYINTQRLIKNNEWVIHTHEVMQTLENTLSVLKDAETGGRGFILTGQNRYLEPYDQAIGQVQSRLDKLTELTKDNPVQQTALIRLKTLSDSKLDELRQTIELRRQSGLEAAMPVILSDRGVKIMDDIRELIAQMQGREQELLRSRQESAASTARWTMGTVAGGIPLSLLVIAIAAIILMRSGRSSDLVIGPRVESAGWRRIAIRYLFAVTVVVLAWVLRTWLLNLGPMPPFITFFPAVVLVAMVSGGGPGILATILSGLVVLYYIVPPYRQFTVESPSDLVMLAIFSATNLSLCLVAERLRRSRWAEAFGLAKQHEAEELAGKNEELAQQAEELSQQTEELAQQNEELQSQAEEIQSLNIELAGRESTLQKILEATRFLSSEGAVLNAICAAAKDLFGPPASAVIICEKQFDQLAIHAQSGLSESPKTWPIESAFPNLVMQEGRTACLNDTSLRPDLKLPPVVGEEPFRAALSSPLRVVGEIWGAVTIYSRQKEEWTTEQFRLIEWLSAQCSHVLEVLRLQDQLRRSERRYRTFVEVTTQFGWVTDANGRVVEDIPALRGFTGQTYDQSKGAGWAAALHPDDAQHTLEVWGRAISDKTSYETEYRMLRHDGVYRLLLARGVPIFDKQGNVTEWVGTCIDITERKLAEQETARLASFPLLNPNPIVEADLNGNLLFANPSAQKLFPDLNKFGLKHPFVADVKNIDFSNANPAHREVYAAERWYYQTIHCIHETQRIRIYSLDISERKRAEQALSQSELFYRQTLESIPGMVFTTRPDGYCDFQSQQWVDFTGIPMSEHLGDGWNKLLHPDDRPRAFAAWRAAVEGRMPYDLEYRVRRHDGRYEWFKVRGVPIRDAGGKIIRWFGVAANIDSMKQSESALQEAKETLEQKVEERTNELAQRATQLRALAGELTLSEQRERSRLAKILHDHLQQLLVAAKFRLAILDKGTEDLMKKAIKEVEDLIDESIASSRSLTAELSPPILHEAGLNAGLEWLARRMADRQGLLVDLELEEIGFLPEDLKILLFESVRELLFNVAKHAHTRSSAVSMRRVDGLLQLTVSDQGVGFDPDVILRAGESGRGFGLFSVRERLELFGGKSEIQSAPGQGSRIFLSVPMPQQIPVQTQPIKGGVQPEMLVAERAPAPVPGKKIRILLADDHAIVRQGMATMLSNEAEFEVIGGAADGQEAVELARELLPDVILMDMSMPRLSGIEATRIIHNDFPEICIIGLSMFEEADRAQAMLEAGAVCYLTKSGAAETLIAAVRKHGTRRE